VSGGYLSPRLLASGDRLDTFECRSEAQTIWLNRHARQAHARGSTSRVFVVTEVGGSDVVANYAWCMASITPAQAIPLLARLGVDLHHEGRGLGAALLAAAAGGCSSMPRAHRPEGSACT
jgi:GNAT superfamily N-acetyltransferase